MTFSSQPELGLLSTEAFLKGDLVNVSEQVSPLLPPPPPRVPLLTCMLRYFQQWIQDLNTGE